MQQQQEGLKQFSVEAYVEKRAAVESLWKKLADREAALKNLEADRGEVWTQKAKWYFKLACGAFDALNADEREEANALSEDEDIRTYDGLCFSMVWDEHEYAKALKDLEQYKEAFRSGEHLMYCEPLYWANITSKCDPDNSIAPSSCCSQRSQLLRRRASAPRSASVDGLGCWIGYGARRIKARRSRERIR